MVTVPDTLPLIKLSGSNFEMGRQHGELLSSKIKDYSRVLLEACIAKTGRNHSERIMRTADKFLSFIESYAPDLADEIKGIRDASGLSLEEAVFLNARHEVMYSAASGCTSVGISSERSETGTPIIAQNLDVPISSQHFAIFNLRPDNAPMLLNCTTVGSLAQMGINSEGLAAVGNAIMSLYREVGVPKYVLFRRILEQPSIDKALEIFRQAERASPSNHILADASGNVLDVEGTPWEDRILYPTDGVIGHANNYLHPDLTQYDRNPAPNSPIRLRRINELLRERQGLFSVDDVKRFLKDHWNYPLSICRHADKPTDVHTAVSIICQPVEGIIHVSAGNPCENRFVAYKIER